MALAIDVLNGEPAERSEGYCSNKEASSSSLASGSQIVLMYSSKSSSDLNISQHLEREISKCLYPYVTFNEDWAKRVPSSAQLPDTIGTLETLPSWTMRCGLSERNVPSALGVHARTRDYKND